ncbi:hypothetical protein GCM10011405_22430 [Rufibacter glacialis]|nr:hypothetical protein GCM10011405_22430 [Rufibacter glacialis]
MLVSGSLGYNQHKNESGQNVNIPVKTSNLDVSPKIAFFTSPNLALGISAGYNRNVYKAATRVYSSTEDFEIVDYKGINNQYSVGPFVRLYKPVANKFAFFGQGSTLYEYSKSKNDLALSEPTIHKGGRIDIAPGLVFFPSNIIGIELTMGSFGYSTLKSGNENSGNYQKNSNFYSGFNLSNSTLGISFYLGRTASE